jgi:hypothetical protein
MYGTGVGVRVGDGATIVAIATTVAASEVSFLTFVRIP